MSSPSKPRLPKPSSNSCAVSSPVARPIRQPRRRFRPKCARRGKVERKASRPMKLICRAAFLSIATQKKRRSSAGRVPTRGGAGSQIRAGVGGAGPSPHLVLQFCHRGGQKGFNDHLTAAREAVERALILEAALPEALSARSLIETNFDYNWKGAAETLRKALALAPQDPALLMQAGNLAAAR